MTDPAPRFHEFVPLLWLALGTFATGTESFMIAALLPGLAADLSVSITAAGQSSAISAPSYQIRAMSFATACGGSTSDGPRTLRRPSPRLMNKGLSRIN